MDVPWGPMAVPTAPGTPAMFVFLDEAATDQVRDGLRGCNSSIFPRQRFYSADLECQEAVNQFTSLTYAP